MPDLNYEVHKRTKSLLSEIDLLLSESSTAAKVDALIESAAPGCSSPIVPRELHETVGADNLFDEWMAELDDLPEEGTCPDYAETISERVNFHLYDLDYSDFHNRCVLRYREGELDRSCECLLDPTVNPQRTAPFMVMPYDFEHEAASFYCGVADCSCRDIFENGDPDEHDPPPDWFYYSGGDNPGDNMLREYLFRLERELFAESDMLIFD